MVTILVPDMSSIRVKPSLSAVPKVTAYLRIQDDRKLRHQLIETARKLANMAADRHLQATASLRVDVFVIHETAKLTLIFACRLIRQQLGLKGGVE